jgi:ligand-binding sensor domain-containing protein/serine phosphatase RsbU (regulator of sigma subunit)
LTNRFINTIIEDNSGFLWIGTGSGLNRFDGLNFRSDFLPDSLSEININCSFKDSENKLWFGSKNGLVLIYNGTGFSVLSLRDITVNAITGFVETEDQYMIISTQNKGLAITNLTDPQDLHHVKIDQKLITSIGKAPDGKFLVGANDGLYIYSMPVGKQPPQFIRKSAEIPKSTIQMIRKGSTPGVVFVGTADNGVYLLHAGENGRGFEVFPLALDEELVQISVKSLIEDKAHNIWIATSRQGLIKIKAPWNNPEKLIVKWYNKQNGLESNNTRAVIQDFEGNIWTGTYGKGLCLLLDEAFSFRKFDGDIPGESINAVAEDDSYFYFAVDNGIRKVDKKTNLELGNYSTKEGLPEDRITSLYLDKSKGVLFIGTSSEGVYSIFTRTGKIKRFFVSRDKNERSVNYITGKDNYLWVATRNGLFHFNLKTGEKEHLSVSSGQLPHNDVHQVYMENEDKIWLSTLSDDLYYIQGSDHILKKAGLFRKNVRFDINAIKTGNNKDVWAVTNGLGLIHMTKDTTSFITTRTGLMSDYCYSLLIGKQGDVWVGHRKGFSRITPKEKGYMIQTYGKNEGLTGDANPNASVRTKDGRLFLGTSKGLVIYNGENDSKSLDPPKVNILSLQFTSEKYNFKLDNLPDDRRISLPYANYKLRIEYVGISYKNPEKVLYQYKLENYDPNWSDLTSATSVEFPRLDDGEYTFYLKAFNSEFQTTDQPASFVIVVVKKPFWKTWWFFTFLAIGFVVLVVVIIRVRERNHRIKEERLEKELDKRTKEVIEKKEELEVKNREITDSINYAQRIQASILPPISIMKEGFRGSFTYFKPRDIVSGDFYWWHQTGIDRYIVICADSTGHGVPGAFMSMIGSTLIKDIVNRNPGIKPSELLTLLDQDVVESLNQRVGEGKEAIDNEHFSTNDGMDIIVCEVNTKTRILRFASAMRPIIMYHQGEQLYIRGNRSSIGGDVFRDKNFDDQEFELEEGDIIYMFSDGYPDQFGGPLGKKFKMARLREMLNEIHTLPMDKQYEIIKKSFEDWQGDLDQVDDVLFMGIQV